MASAFPGMDPYLEEPVIWSGIHATLLGAFIEQLGPAVRPRYLARLEERVFLSDEEDPGYRFRVPDLRVVNAEDGRRAVQGGVAVSGRSIAQPVALSTPDEEVTERSIHLYDARDRGLVTVIELLSPTNKEPRSAGRTSFLDKRRQIYATEAHWMEIDLLRDGVRTANVPGAGSAAYQTFLSRVVPGGGLEGETVRKAFVWPMPLRERLPVIGIPLRPGDPDVALDLQHALSLVINRGGYDLDFDYTRPPPIPLTADDAAWAAGLTEGFVVE